GGGRDGGPPADPAGGAPRQPAVAEGRLGPLRVCRINVRGRIGSTDPPSSFSIRARSQTCETMSFNSLDTLKTGTLRGGTGTAWPVRGLRAMRDLRSFTRKVPKPRI